jgi:hypothetical protein
MHIAHWLTLWGVSDRHRYIYTVISEFNAIGEGTFLALSTDYALVSTQVSAFGCTPSE